MIAYVWLMPFRVRPSFAMICLAHAFSGQAQVMNAGRLAGRDVSHRIPFPSVGHEITDTTVLHGHSLLYLFDTGAPLCIDRATQERELFPVVQTLPRRDANGRMDSTLIVTVDTIRLGELVFCGIPALVLDLETSPLGKLGVQGIIGGNMLRFLLVRFDGPKHEIVLADRAAVVGFDSTRSFVGQLDGQSTFSFPLLFGDECLDTVEVDSGMGDLLVVNTRDGERLHANCPQQVRHTGARRNRMVGMLGKDPAPVDHFRTASLGLGGMELPGPFKFTGTAGESRIGRDLLQRGVFIIDYPGRRYSFIPR